MPEQKQQDAPRAAYWSTFLVAAILIALFVVIAAVMIALGGRDATSEGVWSRYVYVFTAMEAIVFTAIGWILGREVNRSAVDRVERDAANARAEAQDSRDDATDALGQVMRHATRAAQDEQRGLALADAIRAAIRTKPTDDPALSVTDNAIRLNEIRSAQLRSLVYLADNLYPPAEPPRPAPAPLPGQPGPGQATL